MNAEVDIALIEIVIGHLKEVVREDDLQAPTEEKGVALIMVVALVVVLIGRIGEP